MRDLEPGMYAALTSANIKGLVPRRLFYATGKSFADGSPVEVAFWTGDGEATFNVESPGDEAFLTRTYRGGVDLVTSPIPLVSDLTIQTVTIDLNELDPEVMNFVRGADIRLGKVQIHDVMLDTKSRKPVSIAPLVFLGEIDGSPISIGEPGGETTVSIRSVSDVISMLSRTNPAKSSYQEQLLRDGDEFGLYSGTVDTWRIPWGQE